ncbi:maleylpyruvate isomerase family mycothiol-dependent enzyme [Kitasatospora sp. NPDC088351]|uniref:maleylpyruvate isomerase family mycothiol-dependent enzyme n=1 Tax=unclassified Kitasatospora TaxID=2633591 RepID=UPI00343CF5B1
MSSLDYDRFCSEIAAQTGLLAARIEGADLTVPVPSCPDWNVGQLLRHLGGAQRWAETIVRTRATAPVPDGDLRDLSAYTDEDPAVLGPWLAEGAERLAATLRAADPGAALWSPVPGGGAPFYARRFLHETVIHRADATLALGAEFAVDREVALDGLDEWMELGALPVLLEIRPGMRELLGPGRTLAFRATDLPPGPAAGWLVDLTGDALAWRRSGEPAAVTVRAPLTDLLLLVYKRRPAGGGAVEVAGDAALLDFWLERVSFG